MQMLLFICFNFSGLPISKYHILLVLSGAGYAVFTPEILLALAILSLELVPGLWG